MYDAFYGFREKPFSLLPNPEYLYLSPQHEKALGLLELSLHNHAGFCVISGEIGAGKTTLIRKLLTTMSNQFTVGLVNNTLHSFGDLMNWILMAFDLEPSRGTDVERHERFIDFVIQQYGRGRRTVLIVDEAQNLNVDALEELRMLSNVNADKHQVLQVILVGQVGLRETLKRPELTQFAQRILMDFHLAPLGREDTLNYIRHRILVAGADPQIFTAEAAAAVYRYSGGIPRIINLLCDMALVYGYAESSPSITDTLVHAVVRERQAATTAPALRFSASPPPLEEGEEEPSPLVVAQDLSLGLQSVTGKKEPVTHEPTSPATGHAAANREQEKAASMEPVVAAASKPVPGIPEAAPVSPSQTVGATSVSGVNDPLPDSAPEPVPAASGHMPRRTGERPPADSVSPTHEPRPPAASESSLASNDHEIPGQAPVPEWVKVDATKAVDGAVQNEPAASANRETATVSPDAKKATAIPEVRIHPPELGASDPSSHPMTYSNAAVYGLVSNVDSPRDEAKKNQPLLSAIESLEKGAQASQAVPDIRVPPTKKKRFDVLGIAAVLLLCTSAVALWYLTTQKGAEPAVTPLSRQPAEPPARADSLPPETRILRVEVEPVAEQQRPETVSDTRFAMPAQGAGPVGDKPSGAMTRAEESTMEGGSATVANQRSPADANTSTTARAPVPATRPVTVTRVPAKAETVSPRAMVAPAETTGNTAGKSAAEVAATGQAVHENPLQVKPAESVGQDARSDASLPVFTADPCKGPAARYLSTCR